MEGGIEEWEEKKEKVYIFTFTWMSALALVPLVAVIGKVRRGNSRTQSGRGGRGVSEAIQKKSEDYVVLVVQLVEMYLLLSGGNVCSSRFIDPSRFYSV